MDSTKMTTEKNIKSFIEDLLNEIIETVIETASKEKTTIGAIEENTAIDEDLVIVENTVIEEETAIEKETDIDSAVKEIVEELILSACRSSPGGGDVPEKLPTPTVTVDDINTEKTSIEAVDEYGPKGDCVKPTMGKVLQPAKGAEITLNTFRQQVGWLEPRVITPREFARWQRRRRLAAVWWNVKRFLLYGCCAPREE